MVKTAQVGSMTIAALDSIVDNIATQMCIICTVDKALAKQVLKDMEKAVENYEGNDVVTMIKAELAEKGYNEDA